MTRPQRTLARSASITARAGALFAALALGAMAGGAADAAERLTTDGAYLPSLSYAVGGGLEARVDPAGDEILSVHTILRPASSNILWMRDRDGFWTEWSGQRADLIPAAATRDGDELVFKIFETPPPGVSSMTITLAYRTATGLKFGWFDAAEQAE